MRCYLSPPAFSAFNNNRVPMRSTRQVLGTKATSTLLCLSLALLFVSALGSAASAQCVASFREIKFADGSARVKNYVCKSEGSAKPDIRVEFDRLSEAAAGNLIQGEPYPELDKAFGKVRVIDNAVAAEAKKLFDEFGVKSLEETCYAFQVASATGGKGYASNADNNCGKRAMWYITFPDRENLTTLNFPLPADIEYYQANSDWPHGYSFFYKGGEYCEGETSLIYCTMIWRPANAADIANYEANQAAYDKALGLDDYTPEQAAQDVESGESADLSDETDATSTEHLGQRAEALFLAGELSHPRRLPGRFSLRHRRGRGMRWRRRFLDPHPADGARRRFHPEHLQQARVDRRSLGQRGIGDKSPRDRGRRRLGPARARSWPDQAGRDRRRPPRHLLRHGRQPQQPVRESSRGRQDLQAHPVRRAPGTMIELKDDNTDPPIVVKKVRESFAPPTAPKPATYVYGPEIALKGLVVAGKPIVFDQASRNFMQLTAGEGYGSCPYLYSWDQSDKAWVRHGKVIDAANNKD